MTTADDVQQRALALASGSYETEHAVADLLGCCAGRRVSVVIARQRIEEALRETPDDLVKARAIRLLDGALAQGAWDIA
jgi:Fe-S cluster biogenesis protein NfuA